MSMNLGNGRPMSASKTAAHPFTAAILPIAAEPPEPLVRQRKDGYPLPVDALGPLRAPTEAIAQLTAAPAEIAFQSVLAAASLATQHLSDVKTLSGVSPLSLFLLTVAASGERKSSCDRLALAAFDAWEEEQSQNYCLAKKQHDIYFEAYEAEKRRLLKSASDSENIVDLDCLMPPEPPVRPVKILSDITF